MQQIFFVSKTQKILSSYTLSRAPKGATQGIKYRTKWRSCDLHSPPKLEEAMRGCRFAFRGAGCARMLAEADADAVYADESAAVRLLRFGRLAGEGG